MKPKITYLVYRSGGALEHLIAALDKYAIKKDLYLEDLITKMTKVFESFGIDREYDNDTLAYAIHAVLKELTKFVDGDKEETTKHAVYEWLPNETHKFRVKWKFIVDSGVINYDGVSKKHAIETLTEELLIHIRKRAPITDVIELREVDIDKLN